MTDKPQIALEEIELIPHPMDAWRAALDAIIACAPGDESAIGWHLADAQAKLTTCVDRTPATEGTRKLVDRLMLIGAGRIIGGRLSTEALLQEATRANGKCLLTPAGAAARLSRSASDNSRIGRCTRLAHATGLPVQSVYQRLQDQAEAQKLDEVEALNRLEALHLPGADQ